MAVLIMTTLINQFFSSMCLNNLGKWPLSGNHIVFLEDNDVSNLDISSGMVPFGVASE